MLICMKSLFCKWSLYKQKFSFNHHELITAINNSNAWIWCLTAFGNAAHGEYEMRG